MKDEEDGGVGREGAGEEVRNKWNLWEGESEKERKMF